MHIQIEDLVAQAVGDPGSVVGRKLGPSWGRGNDGYAPQEETVTRWSTRAVVAALDKQGALLPSSGRMATLRPGGDGRDTTAIIQLGGGQEIFRFMVNLLYQQVEFAKAARAILVDLRDHMTPERFDPMARSLLGADRYERLRTDFMRNFSCRGCEQDVRVGHRYVPTEDAGAVCAACCKGYPDYVARLVKRQPAAAPTPVEVDQ